MQGTGSVPARFPKPGAGAEARPGIHNKEAEK